MIDDIPEFGPVEQYYCRNGARLSIALMPELDFDMIAQGKSRWLDNYELAIIYPNDEIAPLIRDRDIEFLRTYTKTIIEENGGLCPHRGKVIFVKVVVKK
jgi:hypothetical protein